MKKKKKAYNSEKVFEKIRRDTEIKTFGKLISLRPSKIHENKRKYNRKNNKITNNNYIDE